MKQNIVVVLPDPFRWMKGHGNPTVGLASRSGPEVKNGSSSAKDDASSTNVLLSQRGSAVSALLRVVGRNGEAAFPRGPTFRSPPIVRKQNIGQMTTSTALHTPVCMQECIFALFVIADNFYTHICSRCHLSQHNRISGRSNQAWFVGVLVY